MFCVRVPVLSEKMNLTCPSSSFRVVVRASAGVSVWSWYIFWSQLMKKLWPSRRTSTLSEDSVHHITYSASECFTFRFYVRFTWRRARWAQPCWGWWCRTKRWGSQKKQGCSETHPGAKTSQSFCRSKSPTTCFQLPKKLPYKWERQRSETQQNVKKMFENSSDVSFSK